MSYPEWMFRGYGECGNCARPTRRLYLWRTPEGDRGISCEECAATYGWLVPEESILAEERDQSTRQASVPLEQAQPTTSDSRYEPDTFGKWVVRGIAIAIGFLIVNIPLAVIAIWWVSNQLSAIEF